MSDPTKPDFTMADLLAQLREKRPAFDQGEALTTAEMAEAAEVSENTMRRILKNWVADNRVRVVNKRIQAINGRIMTVTAWVPVQPTQA